MTNLWLSFHEAEKKYVNVSHKDKEYQGLKLDFFQKQKAFDKENKKARRSFQRKQMYALEEEKTMI